MPAVESLFYSFKFYWILPISKSGIGSTTHFKESYILRKPACPVLWARRPISKATGSLRAEATTVLRPRKQTRWMAASSGSHPGVFLSPKTFILCAASVLEKSLPLSCWNWAINLSQPYSSCFVLFWSVWFLLAFSHSTPQILGLITRVLFSYRSN